MTQAIDPYRPAQVPSIAGDRPTVQAELDQFAASIERFRSGQIPEARFLEHRLRFGVYGQRQDGVHMMRSKLPLGLISPEQLDAFADLTEAYSAGVAHLTTRQDIQVHFVPLDRTPDLMAVLADAEMTSREACGNVVRNVCAAEDAGVAPDEAFDVTPYGQALAQFLLRHPDGQSLGRKFKATLAGSFDPRVNLGPIHDLGLTAVVRDGRRGFHVLVGGGLGAVVHPAQVLTDFLPVDQVFATAVAILRVFARHGEKNKRARARMKFLVAKWGIERFRAEVFAERDRLAPHERGLDALSAVPETYDAPRFGPSPHFPETKDPVAQAWLRTNVIRQRQPGYASVRVRVPRGDLTPAQLRGLADVLRRHVGDTTRIAPDQSLFVRYVAYDKLLALRAGLAALGLGAPRAGGLGDTVTCPGADSCKLGITSPRSVARHIEPLLDRLAAEPRLEALRIKISGCPNSCAQQQTADIGLFGAARTQGGRAAPHYMLHLGGVSGGHALPETDETAGFGLNIARVPALRVGEVVERIAQTFLAEAAPEESWAGFVRRYGRKAFQSLIADQIALPPVEEAPEMYREVGGTEPFAIVRGVGECAGEVVLAADLHLMQADQRAEHAAAALDGGRPEDEIRAAAHEAMIWAARALLSTQAADIAEPAHVVSRFTAHFYDAGRVYEGVGHYLLAGHADRETASGDRLRRLVVEAGLFVEEAHTLIAKMGTTEAPTLVELGAKAAGGAR